TGMGTVVSSGMALAIDRWEREFGMAITELEPPTQAAVDAGRATSAIALMAAVDEMARWSRSMAAVYDRFDLLLTPTLPAPPPRLGVVDPLQPLEELRIKQGAMASF